MKLFGKKGKEAVKNDSSKQGKEPKAKKEKKGWGAKGLPKTKAAKGGSKKQKGIIESMALNEAVASMGLSVLDQLVDSNAGSAVRSLDDGYTVLVVTEEMLKKQEVDIKSADFGSFVNAIASEHIQTFLLKNDLDAGVLVIIPDQDTLDVLDEFEFIQDIVYKWGVIPHDVDDNSTVIQLMNGASIGDLNVIAEENIDLILHHGKIVTPDQLAEMEDEQEMKEKDDNDDELDNEEEPAGITNSYVADNDHDDIDDEDDDDDRPIDIPDEEPMDIDFGEEDVERDLLDEDGYVPSNTYDDEEPEPSNTYEDDNDDYQEDHIDDHDDVLGDLDDEGVVYDLQSEEEGRQSIIQVLDREFQNDELGVMILGDAFNQQFGDINPVLFDESVSDDSTLSRTVSSMRRNANTQITKVHNTHMQALRSHFQNSLAGLHDNLVSAVDYRDAKTAFGQRYEAINEDRSAKLQIADDYIAQKREELETNYKQNRESYGDRAKREALAKYDDQNKAILTKDKQQVNEDVHSEINVGYDAQVSDLYEDRRDVARRLFDKMTTGLLLELQTIFNDKVKEESDLYERFREDIDAYASENFSDEVLRASALATQQRQHHEADNVRAEYEQILNVRRAELEEVNKIASERVRELERSHSTTIKDTVADYKHRIQRQDTELKQLREDARVVQSKMVEMDKAKDLEYAQRMKSHVDTIESQRQELAYAKEREGKSGKQSGLMFGGMAIVGIAAGLIGGFVLGTSNSGQIQTTEVPQEMAPGSSYDTPVEGTISLVNSQSAFDSLFLDDDALSK